MSVYFLIIFVIPVMVYIFSHCNLALWAVSFMLLHVYTLQNAPCNPARVDVYLWKNRSTCLGLLDVNNEGLPWNVRCGKLS